MSSKESLRRPVLKEQTPTDWRGWTIFILSSVWVLYTIAHLSNLLFYLGAIPYPTAHRAFNVGIISTLVFIGTPLSKERRLTWLDLVCVFFVVAGCGYIVYNASDLILAWGDANTLEMILGTALILTLMEASRRTSGIALPIIIAFFFIYTMFSDHFPGFLRSTGFSYARTMGWMYLSAEGLWGPIIEVVSNLIAGFVIFGAFFKSTGASKFFIDLSLSLTGRVRGGAGKVAVIAGGLMGMITGSVVAGVATVGTITIPLMKRCGYKDEFSGAVGACAATGGVFTPPVMGAVAFLIADFLGISYWKVILSAAIPAAIFYIVLFNQIDLEAVRLQLRGMSDDEIPSLKQTLRGGWLFLLPIAVLLVFLGVLDYSGETAIMATLASLVIVSSFKRESRLSIPKIAEGFVNSARGMESITPICSAIGIIVGSLVITGAGINLSSGLLALSGGSVFLLLLMAAAANFVLGMGMTSVTCYIITVVLMAPALIKIGVAPMAAHMFLFYYGTISFITPPVAIGAYVAANIAGAGFWKTGWRATLLGAAAFIIPWSFAYNPALVLEGSMFETIKVGLFCLTGALSIGVAIVGVFWFSSRMIRIWERIVMGLAGLILLGPVSGTMVNLIALFAALLISFLNVIRSDYVRKVWLKTNR